MWVKSSARGRAAGFVAIMGQPVIGSPAHPCDSKRPVSATQPGIGRFLSPLPESSPARPRHARMPPRNGHGQRASASRRTDMAHRGFWRELKRRNVLRAAVLYAGASWASAQGIAQLTPAIGLPDVTTRWFLIAALIGFPFWVSFAWFYEFTPQGLKRESELEADASIPRSSGRKLDKWIIAVLALAVVLLLTNTFVWHKGAGLSGAAAGQREWRQRSAIFLGWVVRRPDHRAVAIRRLEGDQPRFLVPFSPQQRQQSGDRREVGCRTFARRQRAEAWR